MPGSQLKRLKASLRDQGIIGPQQSKKQKRKTAQDERARNEKRLHRGVVLEGIREQFNPFDLKHAARGPKFEVTSNRPQSNNAAKGIKGNPGQAKAASEQRRRETLLVDMQHRGKVGGILDRRFGENDPTMTPEERMLERFAREKQRSHKKSSMFDLEDDGTMEGLTHMGQTLSFDDEELIDDFKEVDLDEDYDSDGSVRERQRLKRLRAMTDGGDGDDDAAENEQPERKKTKKEVMEEVIAKSKMHKYERQAAKDQDEDLRMELDKELPNIQMLLSTGRNTSKAQDNAVAPASSIAGVDRDAFDRNFDLEVKRLAQDKRAQPADRTKTEEERAEEESERLREMEDKRNKRMRGESVSDSDDEDAGKDNGKKTGDEDSEQSDDEFGLGTGIKTRPTATEMGFDDEDDFVIEDDLVASGSDLELMESDDEEEDSSDQGLQAGDEEDEFTKGILDVTESKDPIFSADSLTKRSKADSGDEDGLPFTFPCPVSYTELQSITASYPSTSLPTIIQRIRALYHPKLDSKNKERLSKFSTALVDFICSPWDPETSPPFSVLESIIRHVHSLAKMFPVEISKQFRYHIEEVGRIRPLALQPADLVLLTAVGTIFPTSDHFHQVVTPAMLTIGRYLGQKVPQQSSEFAVGMFLSILSLQYQQLSKRFVPEVMNFALNSLCALAPVAPTTKLGDFPIHDSPQTTRVTGATKTTLRQLSYSDCLPPNEGLKPSADCKLALIGTAVRVCDAAADLWSGHSSFIETFDQVTRVLSHFEDQRCRAHLPTSLIANIEKLNAKLRRMVGLSRLSRRPLELHHHRPLAIKTYIPKFEETFDPDKHYDPDRERAELAKLKAEHKKERKGAMRELRKDANFVARENLRIKKAKDEAYEKKYKRLVAEIQSEEGKEANEYEREKKARKRARQR